MKKIFRKIFFMFAIGLIVLLGGTLFNMWQEQKRPGDWSPVTMYWHDYTVIFHVLSEYSLGGIAPMSEIIHEAGKADGNVVVTLEHRWNKSFYDGWEGWHDSVFVITGVELGAPIGHYGYLTKSITYFPLYEGENMWPLTTARSDSTFIFLCHPYHPKNPIRDVEYVNYDGIEILNLDSAWRKSGLLHCLTVFFWYWFFPNGLSEFIEYPEQEIALWDMKLQEYWVTGLGANDAVSNLRISKSYSLRLPHFKHAFQIGRMHLLSTEAFRHHNKFDKNLILKCLKQGRLYVECCNYSPTDGFSFTVSNGERLVTCGDTLYFENTATLSIISPDTTDVLYKVFLDGNLLYKQNNGLVRQLVHDKGIYRAEVFQLRRKFPYFQKEERPWIITNPIVLYRNES